MRVRFLSLFSGIESASVAWYPLGWECVGVAEIEPFPCKVLAHHYPETKNLGDITKITQDQIEALGHIDLVVFGFPCQDLSIAGNRKGLHHADGTSTRSGLFFTAMRIVEWSKARWAVGENVPGIFSSKSGADFAAVVGEMAGCEFDIPGGGWANAGCAVGQHGLIEWVTLDAQFCRTPQHPRAVPQRRRRVFIIRDTGNWSSRSPLFFDSESLRGNHPPSRETRQTITHPVASCATSSRMQRIGDPTGQDNVVCMAHGQGGAEITEGKRWPAEVASTLNTHYGDKMGLENQHINEGAPLFTYGIPGNWIGRKPENGGNATEPMRDVSPNLTSTDRHAVAYLQGEGHGRMDGGTQEGSDDLSTRSVREMRSGESGGSSQERGLERSSSRESSEALPQLPHEGAPDYEGMHDMRRSAQGSGVLREALPEIQNARRSDEVGISREETLQNGRMLLDESCPRVLQQTCATDAERNAGATTKNQERVCPSTMAVRRLLPIECEKLQGFPPNYTNIPGASDSARYKALGNSMAVNVMQLIGQRIQMVEAIP